MKIAYIVGLGRSGSTLLDLMLNAHSRTTTVGEVKKLKSYAAARRKVRRKQRGHLTSGNRCTCQAETIWQCEFWSQVNRILEEKHGMNLLDLNIQSKDEERFRHDNKILFHALGEASGAEVVVDSSKSLRRLFRLINVPGLEVYPIQIVRNPWGRSNSVRKDRSRVYTAAIHYSYDCIRTYLSLAAKPHKMVRYEELVSEPRQQLQDLMHYMGLEFEEGQLDWANQESHNIAGNRMRRGQDSTLKLDTSWRYELTPMQKAGIYLLSAPGRLINHLPRGKWSFGHSETNNPNGRMGRETR